jgi:hypothetical protein
MADAGDKPAEPRSLICLLSEGSQSARRCLSSIACPQGFTSDENKRDMDTVDLGISGQDCQKLNTPLKRNGALGIGKNPLPIKLRTLFIPGAPSRQ